MNNWNDTPILAKRERNDFKGLPFSAILLLCLYKILLPDLILPLLAATLEQNKIEKEW